MNTETTLHSYLTEVFTSPSPLISTSFSPEFIQGLLLTPCPGSMNLTSVPCEFQGYPAGPQLEQIARVMWMWSDVQDFPVRFRPLEVIFSDRTDEEVSRCRALTQIVVRAVRVELSRNSVEEVVQALGPRGLLTCLGVRATQGSVCTYSLPSYTSLLSLFTAMHTSEALQSHPHSHSVLTVGARALTKHCHRSSEGFWGVVKGSEAQKNDIAERLIETILRNCVWINMHQLPGNETVVEVRVEAGYGARWAVGEKEGFRGFLEPHTVDGHENRWRH